MGFVLRSFFSISCFLFLSNAYSLNLESRAYNDFTKDSINWADYYYNIQRFDKAISLYQKNIDNDSVDQIKILKRLALSEAALKNDTISVVYLERYLEKEFKPDFVYNEGFDVIRDKAGLKNFEDKYLPKSNFITLFYFFVAVVGFLVSLILAFNRKIDLLGRLLISVFLFCHSLFIMHYYGYLSNNIWHYPHMLYLSTWSSLLYGPILYFYFKRITAGYTSNKNDLWHLVPTLVLIAFLIPIYFWSSQEKLQFIRTDTNRYADIVIYVKLISLIIYAFFIGRIYVKTKLDERLKPENYRWQRNLYYLHILYIIAYTIYGGSILINKGIGMLSDVQMLIMAFMILYLGFTAYIQPSVFDGQLAVNNLFFPKYQKSGLTTSLSHELMDSLKRLFEEDRIYRNNDISLALVAEKLDTTRHNASQVINEKFNMSFHELVNQYRIEEAKEILSASSSDKVHIIDVAYQVGYNNKVTFNKAFKKHTDLTPSQFQKSFLENI